MGTITSYTNAGVMQSDVVCPITDIHDTTMAPSGTTKKLKLVDLFSSVANVTATNVNAEGAQSAGTSTLAAPADHVHPSVVAIPSDNGLLAYNAPLSVVGSGNIAIAGSLYLSKVWIRQPFTATNLWLQLSNAGSGASTTSFCGIWSNTGTLLTGSSDIGSSFTSGAPKAQSVAWTTPQALTVAMSWVWVGFVFNLATTQPTLRTLGGSNTTPMNTNLATTALACCINGTAVTSLASITPSSNSITNALTYWVGIS